MTADQRLDQLEPIIAEILTVLDRHTLQLKQLSNAVGTLSNAVGTLSNSVGTVIGLMTKQSDNISFLLDENVEIKNRLTRLEGDVAELKSDVAELKSDMAEIKQNQRAMDSKLDLILSKLQ